MMTHVLSDLLEALDRQLRSERWSQISDPATFYHEVEDAMTLSLAMLARIDRWAQADPALRPQVWTREAARRHVPAYQQWYGSASLILGTIKRVKTMGMPVAGAEQFVREYLRAKLVAVDFERNAELLERAGNGSSNAVSREQVINELRLQDGERRAG
jgi:hypothetical protein